MHRTRTSIVASRAIGACVALAMLAAPALAQTSEGGSQFNAGYGWTSGQVSSPVNVSRSTDANNNHVIVDGVTQTGQDGSVFFSQRTSGAADTYTGAGAVGGTAIGNNLQVSVTGSNNTVVVNSTQTNNAPVTATTVLNGQVNLDGGNGS